MVTNFPQIASHEPFASPSDVHQMDDSFGARMLDRVRQAFCGLHGHDSLLQFGQERMFLKCVSCGHETPGWELNETPPTVSVRGDAHRHSMMRPQLISARRIA